MGITKTSTTNNRILNMRLETLDDLLEVVDLLTFIRDLLDRKRHHKKKRRHHKKKSKKPKKDKKHKKHGKKRSSSSSSNNSSSSSSSKSGDANNDSKGFKDYQKQCLDKHNELRALHKDTPPMTLDKGLCAGAQAWANKLAKKAKYGSGGFHSKPNGAYGENLFWEGGHKSFKNPEVAAKAAQCWYSDEIKNYNWHAGKAKSGKVAGHFTQLIWDNSVKLGVGMAFGKKGDPYVVCRYFKPGNYKNQYKEHVHPLK